MEATTQLFIFMGGVLLAALLLVAILPRRKDTGPPPLPQPSFALAPNNPFRVELVNGDPKLIYPARSRSEYQEPTPIRRSDEQSKPERAWEPEPDPPPAVLMLPAPEKKKRGRPPKNKPA